MQTRILTDPPELVDLKREFRELDELTEELKRQQREFPLDTAIRDSLARVQQQKAEIARIVAGL